MEQQSGVVCPVCRLNEGVECGGQDFGRNLFFKCERCGQYSITSAAKKMAESQTLSVLSAWIREKNDFGSDPPEITSETIRNIQNYVPHYNPSQKQLVLLRKIRGKTEYPGQNVSIHPQFDFPMAWASREVELVYYVQSLIDRGLLTLNQSSELSEEFPFDIKITPEGWDYLDQHEKPSTMSDQAFVAMSFSDSMLSAWQDGFSPAIIETGFKPYRVGVEPHIDRIDVKIVTEIKNSRFLVADVTGQKQGVYFEAGYAIGFGIPVIWAVRADELQHVHFDTRQYNHIVWKSEHDLRIHLYDFICAIIGKRTKS